MMNCPRYSCRLDQRIGNLDTVPSERSSTPHRRLEVSSRTDVAQVDESRSRE